MDCFEATKYVNCFYNLKEFPLIYQSKKKTKNRPTHLFIHLTKHWPLGCYVFISNTKVNLTLRTKKKSIYFPLAGFTKRTNMLSTQQKYSSLTLQHLTMSRWIILSTNGIWNA